MPHEQLPSEISELVDTGDQTQLFYFLLGDSSQPYLKALQTKTQNLLKSRDRHQISLGQQLDVMFQTRQDFLKVETMVENLHSTRLHPDCQVIASMYEEVFNGLFDNFSLKNTQNTLKKITERYHLPTLVKALPIFSEVISTSQRISYLTEVQDDLTQDQKRRQSEGKNVWESLQQRVLKDSGSTRDWDQERQTEFANVQTSLAQTKRQLETLVKKLNPAQLQALESSLANLSKDAAQIPGRTANYQKALQQTQPYLQLLRRYRAG